MKWEKKKSSEDSPVALRELWPQYGFFAEVYLGISRIPSDYLYYLDYQNKKKGEKIKK